MARTTTKEVFVNITNKKYIQTFIEILSDALKYIEFALSYKEGVVKVKLYGEKEVVNQSVITVKSYGRMFTQSTTPNKNGDYTHSLKLIQQIGSKIISLDTISTVLSYSGVPSVVEDQDLITKANMQEVQSILERLHDLIQDTPLNVRTQMMKKVLVTVSYCTDYSPDFVLEQGLKLNYFKLQQETIVINFSPEKCISDLIDILSKESVKSEYEQFQEQEESNNQIYFKK